MTKNKALLSLLLLVPAPTIGVVAGMILWPDTALGKGIFMFSKFWLFGLPVLWYKFVDKAKLSFSPARKGGFGFGVFSGCIITAIIAAAYFLLGPLFLKDGQLTAKMDDIGLDSPLIYAAGAAYWICINSVLEEYVWRWFVTAKCEALFKPKMAVLVSALCFTAHHAVALSTFMPPIANIVCSAGICIGGALWSWMYVKYESIWPGYVSHAIVDVAVFGVGAWMIFQ
ncbi:MAG: CPBP family intramembrane glutamic endopeptidase [Planctomycetota bacterium]|jgi:membrane protease YdiL (CAAX protease family)